MFTQRHYIKTAKTISSMPEEWKMFVAIRFAEMFMQDNVKFNRDRFLKACEPDFNIPTFVRQRETFEVSQ